jgi:prevent-host-death family protein
VKSASVHEARARLSKLLAEVERGEEVVIARAGKPIAKLVGIGASATVPTLGVDAGTFAVPDDFDAPLPAEVLDAFGIRRLTP